MKAKNKAALFFITSLFNYFIQEAFSQSTIYKYNNLSGNTNIYGTLDGNFIFTGFDPTISASQSISIFKVDTAGNLLWGKRIYHPTNFLLQTFLPLPDSTFVYTLSNGTQAVVEKLDKSGNFLWSRSITNPVSPFNLQVKKLFDAGDGNVILGTQYNDYFKLDDQGNVIWKKKIKLTGGSDSFTFMSACRRGSQMMYTGSWNNAQGTRQTSVFCLGDTTGNFSHVLRYNYPASIKVDYLSTPVPLGSYNYIVNGTYKLSNITNITTDYLLCIDSTGLPQWRLVYPVNGASQFSPGYATVDSNLNIWNLVTDRKLLVKMNSSGTFLAADTLNYTYPASLFTDNKIYLFGITPWWEVLFGAVDSMHTLCNSQSYSLTPLVAGLPAIDTLSYSVDTTTFLIAPDTQTIITSITIAKNIYCVTGIDEPEQRKVLVYPNPVNDILHISFPGDEKGLQVEIYNMDKKVVEYNSTTIDVSKFSKGIYIIKAKLGNGMQLTNKFLKM